MAANSTLNGPQKVFDERFSNCFSCLSKFVNIMAKVFLIKEAAVILKKLGAGCF